MRKLLLAAALLGCMGFGHGGGTPNPPRAIVLGITNYTTDVASPASPVFTFTHVVNAAATYTVVAFNLSTVDSTVNTITSVTLGGQAMTMRGTVGLNQTHTSHIYSLANPPTGSKSIVITATFNDVNTRAGIAATAIDLMGVSTVGTATTGDSNGTTASVSVASSNMGLVVNATGVDNNPTVATVGTGSTQRQNQIYAQSSRIGLVGTTEARGTPIVPTWSFDGAASWRMVAVSFNP